MSELSSDDESNVAQYRCAGALSKVAVAKGARDAAEMAAELLRGVIREPEPLPAEAEAKADLLAAERQRDLWQLVARAAFALYGRRDDDSDGDPVHGDPVDDDPVDEPESIAPERRLLNVEQALRARYRLISATRAISKRLYRLEQSYVAASARRMCEPDGQASRDTQRHIVFVVDRKRPPRARTGRPLVPYAKVMRHAQRVYGTPRWRRRRFFFEQDELTDALLEDAAKIRCDCEGAALECAVNLKRAGTLRFRDAYAGCDRCRVLFPRSALIAMALHRARRPAGSAASSSSAMADDS